jgi:Mce-associated membrane protein
MSQVTSEAREAALAEDSVDEAAVLATEAEERPDDESAAEEARAQTDGPAEEDAEEATATDDEPGKRRRGLRRRRAAVAEDDADEEFEPADEDDDVDRGRRSRVTGPLVTALAVLLVLLLAAGGWLFFTRPTASSVRTADYVAVLQAARSEIVDLTSFDYLTFDEDVAKVKRITTGDLRTEAVDQLDKTRQDVTTAQAVVSTEVIGAAVTSADDSHGTVVLFIQSTQKNNTVSQAQVLQFHVEAKLTKVNGRWLLSGIQGRG